MGQIRFMPKAENGQGGNAISDSAAYGNYGAA